MPSFGHVSQSRLATCHVDLVRLFEAVVKDYDCTILCGHRTREAQMQAYEDGKSQVSWPDSKHNAYPSLAVDVGPWPLDWSDTGAFYLLAGWVLCTADRLYQEGVITHRIRYGGDWNGNHATKDQNFHDLPHFELVS